jgi:hypothetical protein
MAGTNLAMRSSLSPDRDEKKERPMLRKILIIVSIQMAVIAFASVSNAAEMSPKYLDGVWTLESKENCGLKEFEHLTFRANGTLEGSRFGVVDSVGFWRQSGDLVRAHLVTSPAHFDERLEAFQGYFDYFPVTMLTFDLEADSFQAVGTIGAQIQKVTLFRCK